MPDDLPPELLDQLRAQLRQAPEFDTEAMLARVDARIDRAARDQRRAAPLAILAGTSRPGWRWAGAAAALIALAAGVALLRDSVPSTRHAAAPAGVVYTTAVGERRLIRLADGSDVMLAPETRLTVSAGYGNGQRTVALDGQAMFTVQHDEDRPFRVRTRRAMIEDLGTEFDVRAYANDPGPRVIVASGIVLFRTERDSAPTVTVLERDQMAQLAVDGSVQVRRRVDARALLRWTHGELVFDDAPLEEVAREIGRWYGVAVRVGDAEARAQRLTATFQRSSLDQALAVITQSLDLEAGKDIGSKTVTLRSKRSP